MKYLRLIIASLFILPTISIALEKSEEISVECQEPRPQMCTMIYDPVTGIDKQGKQQPYASGCTACSDPKIVRYTKTVKTNKE